MEASIAATEPLPLVPPTCTSRYRCSGRPSASSNASMRSSPGRMPACSPPRRARRRATASAYVTGNLARSGRLVGEERENTAERVFEVAPLDDQVELAVREQEFRPLKALGKRLANRLGDDPRAGESDQRARLGENNVAEHREARGDAAGGGIGEDRDVRQAAGAEPLERSRGLGHLHQREDALLHPRAARRRDDDHRQVLVDRQLNRARELFSDHRAHAAAEEAELEDGQDRRLPADRRDAADDCLVARGLLGGRPDALAVLLGVLEGERVGRRKAHLALFERARIGQLAEALAGGDPKGIVALRAHASGALDLGAIHDLLARVALDPEALGDDDLARLGGLLFGLASEPGHKPYAPFRPATCTRPLVFFDPTRTARGIWKESAAPARRGAFSSAMNAPTSLTSDGEPARSSTSRTMAEPTAAPSAIWPIAATCSGVLMPNPTQTGLVVTPRSVRIWAARSGGSSWRSPVTPRSDTM